ncbi:hypothetical protein LNQ49_04695 [Flavobacterium sp. F-65]|uniref:Uncharacterized protein n=1 Tax=Flavobacterium pisciphilum TaxID=2893755 RepID=A0ABS8MQ51_9FLAO|nr:hypothetical protein [Flavobacterium sp. F-65]MCC9070895.1 hypothetical protein [Flavobacterium sp. F-65]
MAISSPELGSIGQAEVKNVVENNFSIRTLPKIENKIRVSIDIVPFNRKLHKAYTAKAIYNQNQTKVTYVDSLPIKPELVTIKILDINGLVNELNANYNADVFRLLKDTKSSQIITSLAVSLSKDEITKIRQADAYYLTNTQDKKYLIALYKLGKKTETIDLNPEIIVGYQASKFCWTSNQKGQWYIADIVLDNTNCLGNTKTVIPKGDKKNKSLFDM